jgi:putative inorganic carbon (HCO3(-)) transporter
VDLGIPGLAAWLATLFVVIAASWKVFRLGKRTDSGWIAGLGAGLLGSQVALVIHGLTDAVSWGMVRPAPLVWGIWGIAIAALLVLNHETATE